MDAILDNLLILTIFFPVAASLLMILNTVFVPRQDAKVTADG